MEDQDAPKPPKKRKTVKARKNPPRGRRTATSINEEIIRTFKRKAPSDDDVDDDDENDGNYYEVRCITNILTC